MSALFLLNDKERFRIAAALELSREIQSSLDVRQGLLDEFDELRDRILEGIGEQSAA